MKRPDFMRLLASMTCAFALGATLLACGDDSTGDPDPDPDPDPTPTDTTRQFTLRIENVAPWRFLKVSSQRTKTTLAEGNLDPGDAYEMRFTAAEGHRLSFAMMMLDSNDWFFAPDPEGIPLFTNGVPLSGDITDRIHLWDAGSEYNEEPGVGAHTGIKQADATSGDVDADTTVRLVPAMAPLGSGQTFARPEVSAMVRATIQLEADGYFTLRIQNVSTATTLVTSQGAKPVHISAVDWVLHREGTAFFDAGMPLRANNLERLVEAGDPYSLIDAIRFDRGIATTLSPGVFVIHRNDAPLFATGNADCGAGLEALAEDGNPATLAGSLAAGGDGLVTSGAFDSVTTGGAIAGDAFEVTFEADPGDRLSFATGFTASNDWFFGAGPTGIELFHGNDPRWGDITSEVHLFDLGTESDEELDVGANTGVQQDAPNTGSTDGRTEVRQVPLATYDTPVPYHVRVTLTPAI